MENLENPAVSIAGFGLWLIAGSPATQPYPCRCHESRFGRCSPLWCPCSGRLDPQGPECCAVRFTPAVAKAAQDEYQRKRAAGL